jgi:5-methylcytosine-specific restriction endonuclease McrA
MRALKNQFDWECMWCGVELEETLGHDNNDRYPTLEHIVPLSEGGAKGNCRDLSNLGVACRKCNNNRGKKGKWHKLSDQLFEFPIGNIFP